MPSRARISGSWWSRCRPTSGGGPTRRRRSARASRPSRRPVSGGGSGGGGRPPAPPKAPAAEPGPLPEVPDSALGSGWRGVKRATAHTFSPVLSRFEAMGNAGREVSATVQRAESQHYRSYGQSAEPVVRQLKTLSPTEAENFRLVAEGGASPMSPKVQAAYDAYQQLLGT